MLGYEENEIANQFSEWQSRLHPDDRETASERLQEYLHGRSPHYELEHRLRHKDGSYRWILARGTAVRTADGQAYRMVGSHLDITQRKQAQEMQIRRETQLLAAQRIQERLLPVGPPMAPGLDVAGASRPAEFTGGDHFDYFTLPDGSLGIVVGDVSGHGFGSALVMAATHALIHLLVEQSPDVGEVLTEANAFLVKQTEEERFVTMLLARIDPKREFLTYANAGHPPGFILDAGGKVKCRLESTAFPLGIDPDTEYPAVGAIEIQPDDTVLLLTDGIFEAIAADGSRFGVARALEVVRASLNKRSAEIVAELHRAVREFSGKERLDDDVTCVVIKVEASPASGVSTELSKAHRTRLPSALPYVLSTAGAPSVSAATTETSGPQRSAVNNSPNFLSSKRRHRTPVQQLPGWVIADLGGGVRGLWISRFPGPSR
jgi:PAS domain S-box-containing protein